MENFEGEDGDSEELDVPNENIWEEDSESKYLKFREDNDIVTFELSQIVAIIKILRSTIKDYVLFAKKNMILKEKNEK